MTDYVSVDDIMAEMPDTSWTGKYHETLDNLVTRASRLIDRLTGREDGAYGISTATARTFDGSGLSMQWVDEMAAAPTLVEVDETGAFAYVTWAASDYLLWPYNAAAQSRPYLRLDVDLMNGDKAIWYRFPKSVRITAKWGYSTTPPQEIRQATIIQVTRWFKRAQQAYQVTGAILELGQLRYVRELDPDVSLIIDHYRRVTV